MIDELAKAIAEEGEAEWEILPDDTRTVLRRSALAVLRRLREPTLEMVEAARALGIGPGPESIVSMYSAMIDAAIGKPDAA